MRKEPRNLIILCPDEMRGDCAGFMGNPDIRTPNFDAFARQGVVFERHMTVFPKCVPARINLMTGRYSHTDGYRTINQLMLPGEPNLLDRFQENGYETAVFGKNHCWDRETFESDIDYRSHKPPYDEFMEGRPGMVETEPDPDGARPLDLEGGWHYVGSNTRHMPDEAYAEQAVDFLTNRRDRSRPFFLQLNFESPHPVYGVEEPWFSMYDRDAVEPWPHQLPKNAPLPMVKQREVRTGLEDRSDAAREVQCVYYGMISKVDHLFGPVLEAIEQENLWEDSVLLFWADHGDYAGQYGLAEKWDTTFQDCLIHVPCVLRSLHLPRGHRVESLTETTDLAPTLCELLNFELLPGMHGQSLLPIIRGERTKKAVFCEGGHEDEMLARAPDEFDWVRERSDQTGKRFAKTETYMTYPDTMARAKMVRTDRYKMVIRLRGGNELYDLESDPWEMTNRWGDPELSHVVPELLQLLVEWGLRTDPDRPYQVGFTV